MYKYSFIVPIYNTERYLKRCIESLLNQKKCNYEIILVDDGSTDNSGTMCDLYRGYDNVKVIHKENEGVAIARNVGIQNSIGEYVIFVDSDDWVEPNMLEELDRHSHYDIAYYNYYSNHGDRKIEQKIFNEIKSDYNFKDIKVPSAWIMAIKKEIIIDNNLFFLNITSSEDVATTYKMAYCAENIIYINKPLYNYRKNVDGSLSSVINFKKADNMITAIKENMNYFTNEMDCDSFSCFVNDVLLPIMFDHVIIDYLTFPPQECKRYYDMIRSILKTYNVIGWKKSNYFKYNNNMILYIFRNSLKYNISIHIYKNIKPINDLIINKTKAL